MIRVPACARVSRVSRVCPGSPRCLFTGIANRGVRILEILTVSQSVSYFTVPPRAHPSTGVLVHRVTRDRCVAVFRVVVAGRYLVCRFN